MAQPNTSTKLDYTVAACIIKRNQILLIHHKKLNKWLPPGGHIEANETPSQAVRREMKEEVNMEVEFINRNSFDGNFGYAPVPFHCEVHSVGDHRHYAMFYICKPKSDDAGYIKQDELNDSKWMSREEIEDPNCDLLPALKEQILRAMTAMNEHDARKELPNKEEEFANKINNGELRSN